MVFKRWKKIQNPFILTAAENGTLHGRASINKELDFLFIIKTDNKSIDVDEIVERQNKFNNFTKQTLTIKHFH